MRFRILTVAIAAALMWGCSSTPDEQASTSATGDSGAPTTSTTARVEGVTSSNLPASPAIPPGTPEDFVVNVGDRVHFGFDRFDLTNEARDILGRQAEWLKQHGSIAITVAGHADERGTREYNLALGERRAISVRNYLIALGIDPGRIRTVSYGKERPVDPGSSEEAWTKNRRGVTQVDESTLSLSN